MIDHTGHPHPSTPAARALCRKNGGTGFIGKIGPDVPVAKKKDHDKKPHVPHGPVNTKPDTPKAPSAPKTTKKTVPDSHGKPTPTPKPDTKPPVKKPNPPTARPVPTEEKNSPRVITPKNFDKTKMQIKDGNGNWRDVARVVNEPGSRGGSGVRKRAGTYRFFDANGNLIRETSPVERITVRDKEIPRVAPPPRPTVPLTDHIPPATSTGGTLREKKIQNALRNGASRDFIKSRLVGTPGPEVDRQIDAILDRYGVPNHLYPRVGGGGKPPVAKDVTPRPIPRDGLDWDVVSTPTFNGPEPKHLTKAKERVNVSNPEVEKEVHRVLTIQESHVGEKIAAIRKVQDDLTTRNGAGGYKTDSESTLAVCTRTGHIHLHEDLKGKQHTINNALFSGWFTRGGKGYEQVIAHEMGHAMIGDFKMTPEQRKTFANAAIEIFNLDNPNIQNWYGGSLNPLITTGDNRAKIKRMVSKYAATNVNELMAEVWSEYTMNPKPRPKIKRMGDVLKSIIAQSVVFDR